MRRRCATDLSGTITALDSARSAHPQLATDPGRVPAFSFHRRDAVGFLPADPTADLHAGILRVRFSTRGFHFTSIFCHLAAALALFFLPTNCCGFCNDERETARLHRIQSRRVLWAVHPHSTARCRLHFRTGRSARGGVWISRSLLRHAQSARERKATRGSLSLRQPLAFLLSALSKEMGLIYPDCCGWLSSCPAQIGMHERNAVASR